VTGVVLIGLSCAALWWNEGRAIQTARSLTEGAGLVVSVDPGQVNPANEGKLIHATGNTKIGTKPNDAEFGVSVDGLRLQRTVEMFQWKETKKEETKRNTGGSEETITTYSYVQEWSDTPIDSREFKIPSGHFNPAMRYRGAVFNAGDATLGAYRLDVHLIGMLPVSQELRIDSAMAESLRARTTEIVQAIDGSFYLGANPSQPRIGDMRISYRVTPVGAVSILGQQSGTEFTGFQTRAGDRLLMVRPGTKPAADMFNDAQSENMAWTWIIRAIGTLVMFAGFRMVFNPLVVVADFIPLIGNILGAGASFVSLILTAVIAPLVIAIAWLWYRPLVSLAVIAIGTGLTYGLWMMAGRRKVTAGQPGPVPA
jgi:hypothetical protein